MHQCPRRSQSKATAALVVALWIAASTIARAATPSFAITAPTTTAISTANDTEAVTFSGTASSTPAIRWQAWGVQEDSTGSIVAEALFTGASFSTTVTLNSDTAGKGYTLLVGGVNSDTFNVVSLAITITKDAATCDPTDFECLVGAVLDTAESEINTVLADALTAILALLVVPFDQDDVDAAFAVQDTAKNAAEAIQAQAKDDANDLRDMAPPGQIQGIIASTIAQWETTVKQAIDDWNDQTDDIISDAADTL